MCYLFFGITEGGTKEHVKMACLCIFLLHRLTVFYSDGSLPFLYQADACADQKRGAGAGLKYVCSNIGIVLYGQHGGNALYMPYYVN